jgi:hypothetical protein
MCRSIRTLRTPGSQPSEEEVRAAALQFVRKISGYNKPSQVNSEVFGLAVDEITLASHKMLNSLKSPNPAASQRPKR